MIKPRQIKRGDYVAVLAPSWGGASIYTDVYKNGIDYLTNELELKVKEFPTATMNSSEVYKNPQLRALDINNAFIDPDVAAIISTIGGSDSIRVLKYLDIQRILNNPKVIMGFSDTTTILCYLNMNGLVTYYGNSIMAGFSYLSNFPEAEEEYKNLLFEDKKYKLEPFSKWSDSYMTWGEKDTVGKVEKIFINDIGFRWLNKSEKKVGKLFGGCLEILTMMNGTMYWPAKEFWKGKYLMIETSEDKPSPMEVGFALRNYGIQGILENIEGLLIAKPKSYNLEEKAELDEEIVRIVIGEFKCEHLNIVSNIEFGHTDPRHIMPLGIDLEMDPKNETIRFMEPLFS